jgi:hypothetical protein
MRSRHAHLPAAWIAAAAATATLLITAVPASGATSVVNFDDQSAGTDISNQYDASAQVYFRGGMFGDGNLPHVDATPQSHSAPNVVDIACRGGGTTCGEQPPSVTVGSLHTQAHTVSMTVGYLGQGSDSAQLTLTAYDSGRNPIGQPASVGVVEGAPFSQTLSVTTGGPDTIAGFKLAASGIDFGKRVGFDDLTIERSGTASPDFGIQPRPQPSEVSQGNSVDVPISVNRLGGSSGDINFAVSGLPTGMTASFSPNPVTGTGSSTTMTLTAADSAPASDSYSDLTITATPSSGAGSSARTATVSARVRQNCDRIVRADYIDARTDGCMRSLGPDKEEIFNQNVHLNGLLIAPLGGTLDLIIDKKNRTIKGNKSTDIFGVSVAGQPEIQLYAGPIDWNLGGGGNGPKQVIDVNLAKLSLLKGLPITHVTTSLTSAGKSQITPTLNLNFWPFNHFGAISASTQFTTDNDHGADFTGLSLTLPDVNVLALQLKDVQLSWQAGQSWSGGASLVLNFGHKFEIGGGFGIKNGDFDFLRANVGGLNIDVGVGLFLQRIGVEVHRNPLALAGTIGLTAGPEVAGTSAVSIDGTLKATFADPFVVEVDGAAKIANRFNLGNAFVRYSSSGLFEFGGMVDFSWSILHMTGGVNGWVDGKSAFNIEGSLQGCIDIFGPDICGDAKAVVSSKGLGGCVGAFSHHVGVGATWDLNFDAFTGCDLSPFSETHPKVTAAANVGTLAIPKGLRSVAFELTGSGGPPGVTVTGPGGETVTVSKDAPAVATSKFLAQMRADNTTFILVDRPAGGNWKLSDDGTVHVTRVREARGLPDPSVKATVSGRGRARVLRWRLRPIPGQRVTFAEVGTDVRKAITATTRGSGTFRFHPADGPAGVRRIVALVEQNGRPRVDIDAGSYRAPGPLRPGRPIQLRIVRRGTSLVVSWRSRLAGFGHALHFSLTDNRRGLLMAPARRNSLTLKGVPRAVGAKVEVYEITKLNAKGPAAKGSIKPKAKTGR